WYSREANLPNVLSSRLGSFGESQASASRPCMAGTIAQTPASRPPGCYVAPVPPDVVVIGAGPNGLAGACVLARAGLSVLVLEARPERPGGALASEQAPEPGSIQDVGAAFFPFAQASPAFRELALGEHGLRWTFAAIDSAHPGPDGSIAVLARDLDRLEHNFGSPEDGARMRRVCEWHRSIEAKLIPAMLKTFPAIRPALGLLPFSALRLATIFLRSGAGLSRSWFRSEP